MFSESEACFLTLLFDYIFRGTSYAFLRLSLQTREKSLKVGKCHWNIETPSLYIPLINSPLEKNPTAHSGNEPGSSWSEDDFTTEPCDRIIAIGILKNAKCLNFIPVACSISMNFFLSDFLILSDRYITLYNRKN